MENKVIKTVIQKVFNNNSNFQIDELTDFLNTFIRIESGKDPDPNALIQIIQMNLFNMDAIIDRIGSKPDVYKLQITRLYGKTGNFLRGYVQDIQE